METTVRKHIGHFLKYMVVGQFGGGRIIAVDFFFKDRYLK